MTDKLTLEFELSNGWWFVYAMRDGHCVGLGTSLFKALAAWSAVRNAKRPA